MRWQATRSAELLKNGAKCSGVVDGGRIGIIVEVGEHLSAVLLLLDEPMRPPSQRTPAVASMVPAARPVKSNVHEGPINWFGGFRARLVVKAQRHAAALEELIGLVDVPRRMPELHHMTKASAA